MNYRKARYRSNYLKAENKSTTQSNETSTHSSCMFMFNLRTPMEMFLEKNLFDNIKVIMKVITEQIERFLDGQS